MSKDFGKEIKYNDMLSHFDGPDVENDQWYADADERQRDRFDRFVSIANAAYAWVHKNGLPWFYKDTVAEYKAMSRKTNAAIDMESLVALDTAIGQTVKGVDVSGMLGLPKRVVSNREQRWQIKDYLIDSEEWPRLSKTFREPKFIRLKEDSGFTNGYGLHLGISIPFTEIIESQGALWSPQSMLMMEMAEKFGIMKSRFNLLGTASQDLKLDDGSTAPTGTSPGLFNADNIQTYTTESAGNMTAAGRFEATLIKVALPKFKTIYENGPIVGLCTSGIASEPFLYRNAYYNKLDSDEMSRYIGPGRVIEKLIVTEQLYADTPSASQQCMMLVKSNPRVVNLIDIYPMQLLPLQNKLYDGDIVENLIWGGAVQVKKQSAATSYGIAKTSAVTCTGTGFIPEGIDVSSMYARGVISQGLHRQVYP